MFLDQRQYRALICESSNFKSPETLFNSIPDFEYELMPQKPIADNDSSNLKINTYYYYTKNKFTFSPAILDLLKTRYKRRKDYYNYPLITIDYTYKADNSQKRNIFIYAVPFFLMASEVFGKIKKTIRGLQYGKSELLPLMKDMLIEGEPHNHINIKFLEAFVDGDSDLDKVTYLGRKPVQSRFFANDLSLEKEGVKISPLKIILSINEQSIRSFRLLFDKKGNYVFPVGKNGFNLYSLEHILKYLIDKQLMTFDEDYSLNNLDSSKDESKLET